MRERLTLYFAYGSNMNPRRMRSRCPGAIPIGVAKLHDYRIEERLYADIDYAPGVSIHGVLWCLREGQLRALDKFEGCPATYRRIWLEVEFTKGFTMAAVYELTSEAKGRREGRPFPEHYRRICSNGAELHKIPNYFKIGAKCKR